MSASAQPPIGVEEARTRQLLLLDALVEHCSRHGLTWYLAAGSLLGAMRHEGYVPWDDDIDVMLPRPDYDRLVAGFVDTDAARLRATEREASFSLPFAKLVDPATRLEVESEVVRDLGVFVDVFPLDGWRRGLAGRLERLVLRTLVYLMLVKHLSLSRPRPGLRNPALRVLKLATRWLSVDAISRALGRIAPRDPARSAEAGILVWGYQERVPSAAYGEPRPVPFEGRALNAPADPETVLTVLYGDWRTPPPETGRVTHHRFTAYLRDQID